LAVALAAEPVAAHAELVSADPPIDGSVAEAPALIRLTFSEPVDPDHVGVQVSDARGQPLVGLGSPLVSPNGLIVAVEVSGLEPGVFTVNYEVVSVDDGHDTTGSYAFLFDPTGAAPPPADSSSSASPSVDGLTVLARWIGLVGLLIGLGSVLMWWNAGRHVAAIHSASPPLTLVGISSLVGAVGIAGYVALAARPLPATGMTLDPVAAFGLTPFAIAMRVAIGAALASAAACWVGRHRRDAGAIPAIAASLLAMSLAGMSAAGHAAAAGGPAFAALDWIHLAAVAAWLGALPAAALLAHRAGDGWRSALRDLLTHHGRMAMVAAPIVAMSGIANSSVVLGSSRDLVASDYGNLLVAKALLLAVALGIGAVNHLALRGLGRARVVMLVGGELLVAVVAVAAAATMVTIQPASARDTVLHPPPVSPAHFFDTTDAGRVHVAATLPAPGRQTYRVTITDPQTGAPGLDVASVSLEFVPPGGSGVAARRVRLELDERNAVWVATGDYTPLPGAWQLGLVIQRDGLPDAERRFPLEVVALDAPESGPPPQTGIMVPPPLALAWAILPDGPLAWAPAAAALLILGLVGLAGRRLRGGGGRAAGPIRMARAAVAVVVLVTGLGAASRVLVDAANAPSAAALAAQPALEAPDLAAGRALYLANCSGCHGPTAQGGGTVRTLPAAGSIEAFVRAASDAALSYRIAYGVAGTAMPAFAGSMTLEERSDLIGYLRDRFEGD